MGGCTSTVRGKQHRYLKAATEGRPEDLERCLDRLGVEVDVVDKHGESALYRAVTSDNVTCVRYLLSRGASQSVRSSRSGDIALMVAADRQYVDVLKELTSAEGCPVNLHSHKHNGSAPLHFAATTKNLESLDLVLSVPGVDVDIENNDQHTAFQLAFSKKYYAVAQKLLEKGAKPEVPYQLKKTAWTTLLKDKSLEGRALAAYCRANYINLGGPDEDGWTLIHWAAEENKTEKVSKLVDDGVDINAVNNSGDTALHMAVKKNKDLTVIEELITNHANPNCADSSGRRVLLLAMELQNNDVIKYLLESASKYGNPVNLEAPCKSLSPVQWAISHSQVNTFDLLVEAGALVNGKELMHLAITEQRTSSLRHLLAKNMPYETDKDGNTPLGLACQLGSVSCIDVLLASGNPDVKERINDENKKGDTALMTVISKCPKDDKEREQQANILKSLVESGFDVNLKDRAGQTPIQVAVRLGNGTAVTTLAPFYPNNIDDITDVKGNTLLHLAARSLQVAMVPRLVSLGADPCALNVNQETPLHSALFEAPSDERVNTENSEAIEKLREETITALLETGAEKLINQADSAGVTAMHLAISRQSLNIVHSLLDRGAKMDSSVLYRAVNKEETKVLKVLLATGPSQSVLDGQCGDMTSSAMEKAFAEDCTESFKLLVKAGATVPENIKGSNLTEHIQQSKINKAEMILAVNPDSAGEKSNGVSSLEAALRKDCELDLIKQLLKSGADPCGQMSDTDRPYTFQAVQKERTDVLGALLRRGADPLKTYAGQTLIQAVLIRRAETWHPKDSNASEAAKVILQNGGESLVDKCPDGGEPLPPLCCAVLQSLPLTVATLLTYGADPNLGYVPPKDFIPEETVACLESAATFKWNGLQLGKVNPLELALYRRNRKIVQLLLAAGADPSKTKQTITVGKKHVIYSQPGLRKLKLAASTIKKNKHKLAKTTRAKARRRKSSSGSDDGDDDDRDLVTIASAAAIGIAFLADDDVARSCGPEEENQSSGGHSECIDFSALATSNSLDDYGMRSSDFSSLCSSSSSGYSSSSSSGGWSSSSSSYDHDSGSHSHDSDHSSSGYSSYDSGGHSSSSYSSSSYSSSSACGGSSGCGSSCGGGGGCSSGD